MDPHDASCCSEVDAQYDKLAKVVGRTSTAASAVNLFRPTIIVCLTLSVHLCRAKRCSLQRAVAKFPTSRVWNTVGLRQESTLVLDIPEFTLNTVWDRSKKASVRKTSSIRLSVLTKYRLVTDGQTDTDTEQKLIPRYSASRPLGQAHQVPPLSARWGQVNPCSASRTMLH